MCRVAVADQNIRNMDEASKMTPTSLQRNNRVAQTDAEQMPSVTHPSPTPPSLQNEPKHLLSLPNETLSEIMTYLDHGDRLVIRRVCPRLNSVLINSPAFLCSSKMVIQLEIERSLRFIWGDSPVLWRSIEFRGDSKYLSELHHHLGGITINPHLLNVTEMNLKNLSFYWNNLQDLLNQFPQLKNVGLANCVFKFKDRRDGWSQTPDQVTTKSVELRQRLETLTIVVDNVKDANFCLRMFTGPISVLHTLQIEITSKVIVRKEAFVNFFIILSRSINFCEATLKQLVLSVPPKYSKLITSVLEYSRRTSQKLRLATLHWNILGSTETEFTLPSDSDEANTLLEFLQNQKELKNISLPIEGSSGQLSLQILDSLSPSIVKFKSKGDVLTATMLEKFSNLKTLHCKFVHSSDLSTAVANKIYPELRQLDIWGVSSGSDMVTIIARAFPNLTSLYIRPNIAGAQHTYAGNINQDLQIIIENLINLRRLILGYCDGLTDFGIAGILEEDSLQLMRTNDIYTKQNLSQFGISRKGLPLSSLKSLNTVYLYGRSTKITDVGIHYGLGFNDLRELGIVGGAQMSDWGLVELGVLNPNLQRINIFSESTDMTVDGWRMLKQKLFRITNRNISLKLGLAPPTPPPELLD